MVGIFPMIIKLSNLRYIDLVITTYLLHLGRSKITYGLWPTKATLMSWNPPYLTSPESGIYGDGDH
jgi:hypothetical protein